MRLYLSEGNSKIKKSEGNRVLVWTMPLQKSDINTLEYCKKQGHTQSIITGNVSNTLNRMYNYVSSQRETFSKNMVSHIQSYLNRKSWTGDKVYLKIHDCGDFHAWDYMYKWIEIATQLPQVSFLAYTKKIDFYTDLNHKIPTNLVIRALVNENTTEEHLNLITKHNMQSYKVISKEVVSNETHCIRDCTACKLCFSPMNTITCEIQ